MPPGPKALLVDVLCAGRMGLLMLESGSVWSSASPVVMCICGIHRCACHRAAISTPPCDVTSTGVHAPLYSALWWPGAFIPVLSSALLIRHSARLVGEEE